MHNGSSTRVYIMQRIVYKNKMSEKNPVVQGFRLGTDIDAVICSMVYFLQVCK